MAISGMYSTLVKAVVNTSTPGNENDIATDPVPRALSSCESLKHFPVHQILYSNEIYSSFLDSL